jgi:hypothetical protein
MVRENLCQAEKVIDIILRIGSNTISNLSSEPKNIPLAPKSKTAANSHHNRVFEILLLRRPSNSNRATWREKHRQSVRAHPIHH